MSIEKPVIYHNGSFYYVKLSEHSWLRMSCNGKDAEEVERPQGDALTPYPDKGWHDPPTDIMRIFRAALTSFSIGRRLGKEESEQRTIAISAPGKDVRKPTQHVRKSVKNGHAQQKSA